MVFAQLGVDNVESLFSPVETLSDERAKHPVLLVDAVEESANVTSSTESTSGKLDRMIVILHGLPHLF
jgi:hypothetical protein